MLAIIFAAAIVTTAVQPYDLECTGRETSPPPAPFEAAWSKHIRLDLQRGKWCDGTCDAVFDIAKIDDNQIVFQNERPGPDEYWTIWVNRRTAEVTENMHLFAGIYYIGKGTCVRQPFSGFPPQKF
jgi:hypothetical protein